MLDAFGVLFLILLHLFITLLIAIWVVEEIKNDRKQYNCDCKESKVKSLSNL